MQVVIGIRTHRSIIVPPAELRVYLYYKAFLSSDPSTGDYFVVLIHNPNYQLSFASRAGDDKWTWLPPKKLATKTACSRVSFSMPALRLEKYPCV
jgi:hypothetical protein